MNKIPILICIDVEPDDREIDPDVRHDWKGFEKSYEFFTQLRPRLKAVTGSPVHFSWFLRMDPQIDHTYGSPTYVVTRYRDLLQKLSMMGDELGLHTHVGVGMRCPGPGALMLEIKNGLTIASTCLSSRFA